MRRGVLDGPSDLVGAKRSGPDVAEEPIIGLTHHRIDGIDLLHAGQGKHVADQAVGHSGHVECARQKNGRFQLAQFVDLGHADQLAEAVADDHRRRHLLVKQVLVVRQDGGDAGVEAWLLFQREVPDPDARHVGDVIVRAGGQVADLQAEGPGSRPGGLFVASAGGWPSRGTERSDQEQGES